MKHLLIIGLAVFLACLVGNGARMLIATETIDWEVPGFQISDSNYTSLVWQAGLQDEARKAGIGFGLLTFALATGLGYVGHYTHKQRKQLKG